MRTAKYHSGMLPLGARAAVAAMITRQHARSYTAAYFVCSAFILATKSIHRAPLPLQLRLLFDFCDADHSGDISLDELRTTVVRQ